MRVLLASTLGLASGFSPNLLAERMDENTHSLIIGKLELALKGLKQPSIEKTSITLRLADLYSDRARLAFLKKNEKNCADCSDGKEDRQKAIALYRQAVTQINESEKRGPVLLQLGHLLNQLGKADEALKTYQEASRSEIYELEVWSKAQAAIGDIQFKKSEFKKAEAAFEKALRNKALSNAAYVKHRLAWSQLNQSKDKTAIQTLTQLLQNPENFATENTNGHSFDQAFYNDVVRDLVTFIARGEVDQKEIDLLLSLSPEKDRKTNLYALANELERLGKKYSATLAWAAYSEEGDSTSASQLEQMIRVTQLQWDMGRKEEALEEFTKANQFWKKQGCKEDLCQEIAKRFKNFVINWNRVEKEQVSRECLDAYKAYFIAFSSDPEMLYHAAVVAETLKLNKDAFKFYSQAAETIAQLNNPTQQQKDLLEAALGKQIDAAELSQDKNLKLKAYNLYLDLNPRGTNITIVKYEKAIVTRDLGKKDEALDQFLSLARDSKGDHRELRIKSVDSALDILAKQNAHQKIFDQSKDFLPLYKEKQSQLQKNIVQSAIFMAVQAIENKSSSHSSLKDHFDQLGEVSSLSQDDRTRITILKNQIAIAQRIQDLEKVQSAAHKLLEIKSLRADEKKMAQDRLVWVAESQLDFKKALKLNKEILSGSKSISSQESLRMAILTELSGGDADKLYERALNGSSKTESVEIKAILVRLSDRPWKTFGLYANDLAKSPQVYLDLVHELYAKTGQDDQAQKRLNQRQWKDSPLLSLLLTRDLLLKWREKDRELARHNIYTASESALQRTLSRRIELIQQMEKIGQTALKNSDWLGQLAAVTTLARENKRLAEETARLPIPKHLKKVEKEQYMVLFKQKINELNKKADQSEKDLSQFWKNSKPLQNMGEAYTVAFGHTQKLIRENMMMVARVSTPSRKEEIEDLVSQKSKIPTEKDLLSAQNQVKKDPFDLDHLNELKKLADQSGRIALSTFVEGRIQSIKEGVQK